MKKKRFTEEQIIQILQEAESGLSVTDVCRKHNCSEQSFNTLHVFPAYCDDWKGQEIHRK